MVIEVWQHEADKSAARMLIETRFRDVVRITTSDFYHELPHDPPAFAAQMRDA